ncbi:MAG: mechanosensitive ion channel family protein [Bacteroidota bacterium]|nr:mechanosensitive ion channel family protein [Bacteroidota bacterium]
MAEDLSISVWVEKLITWGLNQGLHIVLIIIVAWFLRLLSKRFVNQLTHAAGKSDRINLNDGEMKRLGTIAHVYNWTIHTLIVVIAAMMILQEFGVKMGPILTSAGIVGVAIGFGGQYLVRDVITGFFIIFENQYRIGDVVTISGITGTVEDITLRVTTLRDADGTVHHIPHGEIKMVSNRTKQFAKINMNIGVAYQTNIDHVKAVINTVGRQLAEDKDWKEAILEAPSFLRIESFDDSSVSIKVIGTTKPMDQWSVAGELRKRLKEAFETEGIDLPFPQRVVHLETMDKSPLNS